MDLLNSEMKDPGELNAAALSEKTLMEQSLNHDLRKLSQQQDMTEVLVIL